MAGSTPKANQLPLQKSLSRRVSFNEASLRCRRDDSDTESQSDGGCQRRHLFSAICDSCCFWISLFLGFLLFVLILFGSIYFAYLKSNLPEVRVQKLDVYWIDVVSTNQGTLLTAEFGVLLNTTNESSKTELIYSRMSAKFRSSGIDFGKFQLEDLNQPPNNSTLLKVEAAIRNLTVEDAAANELHDNSKIHMLVIDVEVRGRIDLFEEGKRINGFPFKIDCSAIDQSEIDNGHAPKCDTYLTPLH